MGIHAVGKGSVGVSLGLSSAHSTSGKILADGKKSCNGCGRLLPATPEFFVRNKNMKDGLQNWCRDCMRENTRKWRKSRPNYSKEYYDKNKEKVDAKHKEYYEANRETISEKHRTYSREHKEEAAARNRKNYMKNREKIIARHRAYYYSHKEQFAEYAKRRKMGIARYRDAETGELIPGPTTDREYVVERPWSSDWGGDPIWPDERPVTLSLSQSEAKALKKLIGKRKDMKEITDSLEHQIWKYRREDYV